MGYWANNLQLCSKLNMIFHPRLRLLASFARRLVVSSLLTGKNFPDAGFFYQQTPD